MREGKNIKRASGTPNIKKNNDKNNLLIIVITVVVALLIFWICTMVAKTKETVSVVMYKNALYKNAEISADDLIEYEMLKGEFEKYAVENKDGTKKRRIVLWEERGKMVGTFAAYPLKANTVAEYRDVITSRIDNSDSVLYSFPGKNIVKLDIGEQDLKTFKTFLEPGDRINIIAIYSEKESVRVEDEYGGYTNQQIEVYREEEIFPDIMLADLLNRDGDSILDIYAAYKDRTTYEQAALDSSEAFKESVEPKQMIVALTPEEEERYYYYLGKSNIEFRISLPQRTE